MVCCWHHTPDPRRPPENAANRQAAAASGLPFRTRLRETHLTMNTKKLILAVLVGIATVGSLSSRPAPARSNEPAYTTDGQMRLPANYREWVYLSTGFDMSYSAAMNMDHHMFDNVFVNPEAYQVFQKTGSWPDKTMMVLEVRGAQSKGSINQAGQFQSGDVMGLEVHVKDESRFQGNWAFFGFDGSDTAKMTPTSAACYSCHAQHAAVDTTFVQFYPTLLPIAKSHSTLSPSYTKESTAATPTAKP
jgi:Cytochrome P460